MSASQYPNAHIRVLGDLLDTMRSFFRQNPNEQVVVVKLGRQAANDLVDALDHATQPRIEGYSIVATELTMRDLEKLAGAIGKKLVPIGE